jgi:cellulose synthase/poly-beta-1,6-N-acetylglucosamine synthase-like glycosyltransferase
MIQYILWGVSFISLWISLVWLNVLLLEPLRRRSPPKQLPRITIALPCYNREQGLAKTVRSLAGLRYPLELLQVIIVDDCSTDNTAAEARRLKREYPQLSILLLSHKKNRGKAAAMNTALARTTGELFTCLDADTHVRPDSVMHMVGHFTDKKLGAIIGQVKVDEPRNVYEHVQRIEYIASNFIRRMMSNLGTLAIAPGGALAMFNTAIVRKVGGFAEAGLTEDLEIALRLRSRGYAVRMEPRAMMYTRAPQSWTALWRQRIRWYRGFLVNHIRYRSMLFSRKHGLYGMFQMPLNVLAIVLLLTTVLLVGYGQLRDLYELLYRSLTIKGYFLSQMLDFPTLKEMVLSQNVQITLPIIIGAGIGLYLLYIAHTHMNERLLKHAHHVWLYVVVFPFMTTMHWLSALAHEAFGTRRKW